MLKLGERKDTEKRIQRWGGRIEKVWLTKWMPTGEYQLLGLVRKENGEADGWCTLTSGSLKECRAEAKKY